ncbi:hypothetical protein sscle_15g106750 [Sclerotinia sclerotiorum 1980 UF-70]|uniref:Uncharacterized protein n=1 Tax=Sclerotinia sclerotiorum (strain ATCC 18683 / 1980 / Ss-1) TaxID=665079 RepID=A0A1D9QLU3_SCLS1|nr:hypothetical protein sscle_15g106750 [Sclerotinia sclerotiorum 1980 UF-70]
MPPLPRDLPKRRWIMGQARWHIPHPELPKSSQQETNDAWNPEDVYNSQKKFPLEAKLTPVFSSSFKAQPGDIIIYLRSSSRQLIRWLCALLAPGLGWIVKGPLPPWTAHYDETARFVIVTDVPFNFLDDQRPPAASKATELLIEFCRLYGIGSQNACTESLSESLPQPTTGFLAALALPFYNALNLQPRLPVPRLVSTAHTYSVPLVYIRKYMKDLRYFMTLRISPASVGSVIWSIFWQPGLGCNLVSVWFGSILKVIRPLIEAGNTKRLSNVFALRRERAGLLWRAIFHLADPRILDMIVFYLETHE